MIFVLLESENNLINPVIPRLCANIHKSCVKKLPNRVSMEQIKEYKKPPLFEMGWFLVYNGEDKSVIKFLSDIEQNITVFSATSRSRGENIVSILAELNKEYKIIDNLRVSKQEKLAYIRKELCISESDVNYLYNRTRGYIKDLTNGVCALKSLPVVTRSHIKAVVPKTEKYGLNDLYDFLIGVSDKDITYEDCIKLIYRYRYGLDFLKEFLLNKLEINIKVFELIGSGELSIENYRENKPKSLASITEFQLYKLIEQYNKISYDYLYFLYNTIAGIGSYNVGLIALLNIMRLRKERN